MVPERTILFILRSHFTTFFSAAAAGFGALLAMLHVRVFATFRTAGFAHVGTKPAHFFCLAAAEAHKLRGSITDCGTFHVKLNAARHHFHVVFLRARGGAMVADGRAIQAGFNTGFVGVIAGHDFQFLGV